MIPSTRHSTEDFGRVHVYGRLVLAEGEFDAGNSATLRSALGEVTRHPGIFIVDLTAVDFLDSSAVRAVWDAATPEATVLVATGSLVARLVQLTGLHRAADVRFVEVPGRPPVR